jgi:hypothetical protein
MPSPRTGSAAPLHTNTPSCPDRARRQAMHSLFLPRPTPLPSTPFGPSPDQDNGLAKLFQKFSPTRSEQHGYPSPPMSEPHSPTRRSAQPVESERTQYAAPATAPPAGEAVGSLPTPSSAHFDTRPPAPFQSNPQQRPLYSGEPLPRHQPYHYQAGRSMDHASYGSGTVPQSYAYAYPSPSTPSYLGAGPHTGLQAQPGTMIAPPPGRPTKPARRTKAHVASACVNCKKAHLSCDVQRPCGRCVASGKQVSSSANRLCVAVESDDEMNRKHARMCSTRKEGDHD